MTKNEILSRALESLEFVVADLDYLAKTLPEYDSWVCDQYVTLYFMRNEMKRLINE